MAEQTATSAGQLREQVGGATDRLLATAAQLTDEQVKAPSLLPGWSRGHVLTHLARNADGLRNLLIWARTGVPTPQYASPQARDAAIAAGADRTAAEQAADIRDSAAAFDAEAGRLSTVHWQAVVRGMRGPGHPAVHTLWRRLSEVEIHHVDLDAGYGAGDWPADFVAQRLAGVAAEFAQRADSPAALLRDTGSGELYPIGAAAPGAAAAAAAGGAAADGGPERGIVIAGPGELLLAWLIGRSQGAGLTADPSGPLPAVPAW